MGRWGCDELWGRGGRAGVQGSSPTLGQEVVRTPPCTQGDAADPGCRVTRALASQGPGLRTGQRVPISAHPAPAAAGAGLELARCRLPPPSSSPTPLPLSRQPIHKFSASCLLNLACLPRAARHAHQHAEHSCCRGDLQPPRSLHRHWAGAAWGRGSTHIALQAGQEQARAPRGMRPSAGASWGWGQLLASHPPAGLRVPRAPGTAGGARGDSGPPTCPSSGGVGAAPQPPQPQPCS